MYADRQTHTNDRIFTYRLSRLGLKDSVLDFPLAFAERRGIDHESIHQKLTEHLAKQLEKWKNQITDKIAQWVSADKALEHGTVCSNEQLIDIDEKSFKTLLIHYVDMELEQTRLVNAMHSAKLKDFEAGKGASLEVLAHAEKMQAFAKKIIEHPEIKSYLSVNKDIKLADRGGFVKIRERFQKGEWLDEDIYLLIKNL